MNNFGNNNRKQLDGKFEQQFKNKFENAQFAPPAHLWEQIDAALDAKPWYKRPLFYWTSGLVAALLLVVMFWFTLVYDNSTTPSTNDKIANSDKNKIENSNISTDTNNSSSSLSNKGITQTPNNVQTEVTNSETKTTQENNLIADSDTKNINSSSSIDKSDNSTNTDQKTDNNNSDVAISIALNNKDTNKDLGTSATNETIVETTPTLELIVFKEIDWSKYLPVGNPYFEQEDIFIKVDSTKEAIANNQNNQNPTEDSKKSSGIALTFGINHTQGIYKPSFRIDSLYSGLTVIEAETSNLADTLTQMNISGTYQQTGFDIALAFGKNKRWSINTGLGMGKANYSFGSTNYTRDTVLLGNPLIASTNNVEVSYEWLQIPIAIGYQFGESRSKKFTGFAQFGTVIELLSSYSYTSADPNFTYALGNHRTTNTQVWTQAGINYHVTNRWTLWGGGTYKSSLSSLINEGGVTFSSQAYGWQVGTRFTIFKSK